MMKDGMAGFAAPTLGAVRRCRALVCLSGSPVVGLTRERGKNDKLGRMLEQMEIRYEELPCVAHADGQDVDKLAGALSRQWTWIVVTSPEAARVLIHWWRDLPSYGEWSIAAVGGATAKVLEDSNLSVSFTPLRSTAEDLCAELPGSGGDVLYPASALASQTISERLQERGFSVTRLNTYTTVLATWSEEERFKSQNVDIVAVGSPSALQGWIALTGKVPPITACIGGTSAKASRAQGVKDIFFSEFPGIEGWSSSIEDAVAFVRARQGSPLES